MRVIPIIALILLLGFVTDSNLFSFGACVVLLVFQLSRYFAQQWSTSIAIDRSLTKSEMEVGETVSIGLKLHNSGNYFIPWMFVEDNLPHAALRNPPYALQLIGHSAKLYFFGPKQTALMTYQLKALRRGYFQIGPTILETGDLLGLHRKFRLVLDRKFILVLPKIVAIQGMDVTSRRPMGELRIRDRAFEDPTQMVGIREYQPGDPLNRLHWKATARTGVLHSRVFQPTSLQGAMIVLDMHRSTNPDRNEPIRTDLAVTAAASIAHTLYLMNQPYGLISNGRDAADRVRQQRLLEQYQDRESARKDIDMLRESDRIRPVVLEQDRGPEHFADLHRTLARLERTDGLTLPQLISETQSRMPRQMSILVIAQCFDDQSALALSILRRQGFAVSAIINQHAHDGSNDSAARLMQFNVPTFMLPDEKSLPVVCTEMLLI